MALHALARPLAPRDPQPSLRMAPGISMPQRRLPLAGELNIILRRRRAEWRNALLALSIAGAWVGVGCFLLSRLG